MKSAIVDLERYNKGIMYNDYYQTPIGTLQLEATAKGISKLLFIDHPVTDICSCDLIRRCISQLDDYFSHQLFQFKLPLDLAGTVFQQLVWGQLASLPYGVTSSYGDIAKNLHRPKAVRAVGAACGKNPVTIIVPCHRIIASNGKLTGYVSGLDRKSWLLKHEGGVHHSSHSD
jgi:methylated-DNA-[protein]-cysteine S-methyltransferase